MKKLLILFIFTASSAIAQTTNYQPFPENDVSWNFNLSAFCFGFGTADEYFRMSFSGDTTINSVAYRKLISQEVHSNSTGMCGNHPEGYKGAIRQNISEQKVYFVPKDSTSEQLLYDFTLGVGDTLKGYLTGYFSSSPDLVTSIDTTIIDNTPRRVWNFNSGYGFTIIEGIGSTYGLIEFSPQGTVDLPDYTLVCFEQSGITLFPDTAMECQSIDVDQFELSTGSTTNVYPNPFSDYVHIETAVDHTSIIITNGLGQVCLQQNILIPGTVTFHKNDLPSSGVYYLQILHGKSVVETKKLIAID